MVTLRSFDAFPRQDKTQGVPFLPLVAGAFLMFVLWIETSNLMGAHADYEFAVDKSVENSVVINLQLLLHTKCAMLDVFIVDAAEDKMLVNEVIGHHEVPAQEDNCWIRGSFETNRVKGSLIVTSKMGSSPRLRAAPQANFTHFISELSFGEYYPNRLDPLEGRMRPTTDPNEILIYYLNVVPTTHKALGLQVDTHQYSVTEASRINSLREQALSQQFGGAIVFNYDFDPIHLTIIDSRISFFQWFLRIVNIIVGGKFLYQWVSQLFSKNDDEGLLGKFEEKKPLLNGTTD